MMDFPHFSGFEILKRIELRGEDAHSWIVIVGAENEGDGFAVELEERSDLGTEVRIVNIEGLLPSDIRDRLQAPPNDHVILVGFEGRSKEFWGALDINRSALDRAGGIFFWLTNNAL